MKRKITDQLYYPEERYCMGFRFSAHEDWRMHEACVLANRFMSRYGKGRKPFSINLSHYANAAQTEQEEVNS